MALQSFPLILRLLSFLSASALFVLAYTTHKPLLMVAGLLALVTGLTKMREREMPRAAMEARVVSLREQGIYPLQGMGTDADVERLVRTNEKLLAIRLYREIHEVPLKEAVEAVKEIHRRVR